MKNLDTKERILESAHHLFSVYGYHGTQTTEIAKVAGVSQGLVFHYFGSKEQIWHEVKQRATTIKKAYIQNLQVTDYNFDQFLEELVFRVYSFYYDYHTIMRIETWDQLELSHPDSLFSFDRQDWEKAFEYYQRIGAANANLTPKFMVQFAISSIRSLLFDCGSEDKNFDTYMQFCVLSIKKAFIS